MNGSSKQGTLYLGIDQGSSSTKSLLLSVHGDIVWSQHIPVATKTLSAREIEQDPDELFDSVQSSIRNANEWAQKNQHSIAALGFSFQRSGVCAWEKSGKALSPLFSWQDTRTADWLESKRKSFDLVQSKTFVPCSAHYAAPKIALLQREHAVTDVRIATLDSFVIDRLLGDFITEDSMAHRTMLYDLKSHYWDDQLCDIFEVVKSRLPQIRESLGVRGNTMGIPLAASLGDQQATLLAQSGESAISISLGTVAAVYCSLGEAIQSIDGYITSVFYSAVEQNNKRYEYFLEGTSNQSGRTIQFIKTVFGVEDKDIDALCQSANEHVLAYCPFGNTSSPEWRSDLPNLVINWEGATNQDKIAALVSSLACFVAFDIEQFQKRNLVGLKDGAIPVTGGLAEIDYLLQFLADCIGLPVKRVNAVSGAARGAAFAASCGIGYPLRLQETVSGDVFSPKNLSAKEFFSQWKELRQRALNAQFSKDLLLPESDFGLPLR